jgi:putative spermidine/putrescine transport system substrate-binding protein
MTALRERIVLMKRGTTGGLMHRGKRFRTSAAAVVAVTTLTTLGAWVGTAGTASAASSNACWAKAVTINSCGGMRALVKAAKAEGTLNLTADPDTWANYGNIIKDFAAKYGLKVNDFNPNGTSAEELSEIVLDKGKSNEPDVVDVGPSFAAEGVAGEPGTFTGPILARYKVTEWNELPAAWKNTAGYWAYDYSGVMAIGYNASVIKTAPTSFASLLNPEFKDAVGLSNNPTSSNAGFSAVYAAALANGGSLNNIQPGLAFFSRLNAAGNYNPVEAGGAGDAPMADKTVLATLDWTYNQLSWQQELKSQGINWKIVIPKGKPYASYYAMAISASAAHPAAARLFLEYMYSPTGQNLWLEGGAVPSTITAMQKAGTVSKKASSVVPALPEAPAIATNAQSTTAQAAVVAGWPAAVG